ncbi:tetratricopeptide repeat protein [Sulfuricystis multivorans]|uniref:tetratricopeptide repeat protein n=1 Tax=Sulfuricystis multivorans TaxID=2211108 RepID=UPI000F84D57D|nr:tetratricopeptide repeat protein [Sulfuricystis multivorans]
MDFLDRFFGAVVSHEDAAPAPYIVPLQRRDYAAAVPLLKAAMNRGDACAMGFFAALSALGRGVEKNPQDACAWFRQAAIRGHVPSQAALGMCLAGGLGTLEDRKEAAYWLYRAGKAGNMQAIEVLGALAYKDNSVVGEHFTEDELCKLVMQMRKQSKWAGAASAVPAQLH